MTASNAQVSVNSQQSPGEPAERPSSRASETVYAVIALAVGILLFVTAV